MNKTELQIQADSPYNDGWTRKFYHEQLEEKQEERKNDAPETVAGTPEEGTTAPKQLLFVQYRGKASEDFARALHKAEAPCTVVFTLRKLRSVLPSLKPSVPKNLRGSVVYKLKCPRCAACYVGQTDRHFCTRLTEHQQKKDQPVYKHFQKCGKKTYTSGHRNPNSNHKKCCTSIDIGSRMD